MICKTCKYYDPVREVSSEFFIKACLRMSLVWWLTGRQDAEVVYRTKTKTRKLKEIDPIVIDLSKFRDLLECPFEKGYEKKINDNK